MATPSRCGAPTSPRQLGPVAAKLCGASGRWWFRPERVRASGRAGMGPVRNGQQGIDHLATACPAFSNRCLMSITVIMLTRPAPPTHYLAHRTLVDAVISRIVDAAERTALRKIIHAAATRLEYERTLPYNLARRCVRCGARVENVNPSCEVCDARHRQRARRRSVALRGLLLVNGSAPPGRTCSECGAPLDATTPGCHRCIDRHRKRVRRRREGCRTPSTRPPARRPPRQSRPPPKRLDRTPPAAATPRL